MDGLLLPYIGLMVDKITCNIEIKTHYLERKHKLSWKLWIGTYSNGQIVMRFMELCNTCSRCNRHNATIQIDTSGCTRRKWYQFATSQCTKFDKSMYICRLLLIPQITKILDYPCEDWNKPKYLSLSSNGIGQIDVVYVHWSIQDKWRLYFGRWQTSETTKQTTSLLIRPLQHSMRCNRLPTTTSNDVQEHILFHLGACQTF